MSDAPLGVLLLVLGAWGTWSTIRDVRHPPGIHARAASGLVAVVGVVASVAATLTGAALLLESP